MRRYISLNRLIPLAVFALALLLRLIPLLRQPFDGLYGQDAYAYFDFAAALRNTLLTGEHPGPFFWGLGYPAFLAGLFIAGGGDSAGIAQAVSILMGAAIPALVTVIALQSKLHPLGALTAGLILAVCGQAVQSSLVIMADVPALFWAVCAALLLILYVERPSPTLLVGSALCLTLAILSRWLYGTLLIPFAWLWLSTQRSLKHLLYALISAFFILLPQVIYSVNNPFPVFNHAWVMGWSSANALARDFTNIDGQFHYALPNFQFYAAPLIDPYYFAPILLPFTALGIFSLRRRDSLFWCLWLALPLIFLMGIPYQNIRFPLIVMPAVAMLTGGGIDRVLMWFEHSPRFRYIASIFACVIIAFALVQTYQATSPTIETFLAIHGQDKQTALWVGSIAPEQATIYAFGLTLTLSHTVNQQVEELYYFTPDELAAQVRPGDYLLVNVWQLENQWFGRDVYACFAYLRDQRGLRLVGRHRYYTLFEIS